jgi:RNA polymerase sigma-70 factor (ECF subfamily)
MTDANTVAVRVNADRPQMLRFLRGRLPSPEDAEDALQDATLKFLQNANALSAAQRPAAWVSVSLGRVVIDRYRRAASRRRMTDALAVEPGPSGSGDDEDTLTPAECVKSMLPALKPAYAAVIQWVYLDERTLKEVAARLDLTPNNAAVRLHRARAALRETMSHKFQACPLSDCWARQHAAGLSPPQRSMQTFEGST